MVNPEGLCSPKNPWGGGVVLTAGWSQGATVNNVSPFQMLVFFTLFKTKWNTGDCLEEYTWNVVSSYWFGLVPDPLVKSVALFLDFLLVFGVGAPDVDNWWRLFLWIQHCSQAAPSIFLSRESLKLLSLIKILFNSNSLFVWSCSRVWKVSRRIVFFFFSRKEVKTTRLKGFNGRF